MLKVDSSGHVLSRRRKGARTQVQSALHKVFEQFTRRELLKQRCWKPCWVALQLQQVQMRVHRPTSNSHMYSMPQSFNNRRNY